MENRALVFTTGSPFARVVRITLDELNLPYEKREEITTPSIEERSKVSPTLQVPTLWDGEVKLWGSDLIVEYLLHTYLSSDNDSQPIYGLIARPDEFWEDKLLLATIQTLGTAATIISQMKWGGVSIDDSDYLKRSADRFPYLMAWLEKQIDREGDGFIPGFISAQDLFLVCHLDFITNRPLGLDPKINNYPRISALCENLKQRKAFQSNPILWWEPGVVGYDSDGVTPIYKT